MTKAGAPIITFRMEARLFDRAVKSFVKKYTDTVENSVKRLGFELLRRTIIRTTRVCTGRMRNGWHVSFHRPSSWEPLSEKDSKPSPGLDMNVKVLYVQNNVYYAVYHEWGTNRGLKPLLMLTRSVQELRGEIENYFLKDMEPLWNKEINGITSTGLVGRALQRKQNFLKSFPRTAPRGVCRRMKGLKKRTTR